MNEQTPVRVTVVDDHPMWRDAVERDLQAAGFDVVGAGTVQNHVQHTLRKPQLHNRVELTRYEIERGLEA